MPGTAYLRAALEPLRGAQVVRSHKWAVCEEETREGSHTSTGRHANGANAKIVPANAIRRHRPCAGSMSLPHHIAIPMHSNPHENQKCNKLIPLIDGKVAKRDENTLAAALSGHSGPSSRCGKPGTAHTPPVGSSKGEEGEERSRAAMAQTEWAGTGRERPTVNALAGRPRNGWVLHGTVRFCVPTPGAIFSRIVLVRDIVIMLISLPRAGG